MGTAALDIRSARVDDERIVQGSVAHFVRRSRQGRVLISSRRPRYHDSDKTGPGPASKEIADG
jgi:hypothetical protein